MKSILITGAYGGMGRAARESRAHDLLIKLGLDGKTQNKPNELSGGQQQRVSIARAMMNGGEIILADEPTGALDSKSGENVMKLLMELNAEGHTLILVTHDRQIASYANRVIEIKDGAVISDTRSAPILKEEEQEVKAGHIALIGLAKDILEQCIHILGFEAPEKM